MKRGTRWIRRLAKVALVCLILAAIGFGYQWRSMAQQDAAYAEFCACGESVGDFLKQYAKAIGEASHKRDASELSSFFAQNYFSAERGSWEFSQPVDLSGAQVFELVRQGKKSCDQQNVITELQDYVNGIQHVDQVICKIDVIEEAESTDRAVIKVKFLLDGRDQEGRLFQDRFFFRWTLEKQDEGQNTNPWKIVQDELIEGLRVAGNGDVFERVEPREVGIDYVHQRDPKLNKLDSTNNLLFSLMEHVPGGVSAVDYDDDGRIDLFFADGQQCRLYRNTSDPGAKLRFVDVTDASGLGELDQASSALFFDVDNDGDKDLYVARYLAPGKLFRNNGQHVFEDVSSEAGVDFEDTAVSACVLDFDQDGFLDLYIASYGNAFEQTPNITFFASNGQSNRLLRNVDGTRFVDVTEQSGTGGTAWSLAVTSGDYDRDGYPDLAIANDLGRKVLYRNNGDGTFTDQAKEAGVLDFGGGMGVVFADLDGDAYPELLTANIDSGQKWFGEEVSVRQYLHNIIRTNWIWQDLDELTVVYGMLGDEWRNLGRVFADGNSIFGNNKDGTFVHWEDADARRAGWTWGIQTLDYDNDTDLDIYVANGWISGKRKDDL